MVSENINNEKESKTTVVCDLLFSVLLRDEFARTQSGAGAMCMHVRYCRYTCNKFEFKTNNNIRINGV